MKNITNTGSPIGVALAVSWFALSQLLLVVLFVPVLSLFLLPSLQGQG